MSAELVIVGAGPAGAAAALAAARHGLSPLVIDEQSEPGGQVFRRPPPELDGGGVRGAYRWGERLLERFAGDSRIRCRSATTAWGVFQEGDARAQIEGPGGARSTGRDGRRRSGLAVALHGPGGAELIDTGALVIATGAYELPVPFPGWTLPGVLSAGGAQAFVKAQRLRPAERVVLAGSHPLLLLVADQLLSAGARIAEVAVARPRLSLRERLTGVRAAPGHAAVMREAAAALLRLRRARVPIRWSTIVTGAAGEAALERVRLAAVDTDWRVRPGSERELVCDGLVLGYGFAPAVELAAQAGCGLRWSAPDGGWVVRHDEDMRTDVPGVYAAGEPTGVTGAEQAAAEGTLAGLAIVRDLAGRPALEAEINAARGALRRARRFSAVVNEVFALRPEALAALVSHDTLVCRCERVRAAEVRQLLAAPPFPRSANAVKLAVRTGMGLCQGRYCERAVAQLVAAGGEPQQRFTSRLPVKPVPLSALAALDRTCTQTTQFEP
jgi:NADPH-dependent 2,4-dienoyl-CoA reductase/sulfur reductase-like enzyme